MKEILKSFLVTLPIYVIVFFLLYDRDKITPHDIINQLNQRDSIISQMIDNQGRLVTTHTNREYTPFVIQNSNAPEMVELRKELKNLGIKIKDLNSVVQLSSQASGAGVTEVIRVPDALDTYSFQDTTGKHLKQSGRVDVVNGMMDYKYTYSSNYSIYSYDYKKNIFKKPELRLKIISDDSSNTIKAKTFTINPPRDIISIGGGIGVSGIYDNGKIKFRPSIHIGIYKALYTFRTKK